MTGLPRERPYPLLGAAAAFAGAAAVALYVVRPLSVGPIGPDAAAPVVEFQRLVAGQQLEGYLSQTSKPLLTLVYGVARSATGDWRSVSLLAILSFALLVALAGLIAHRLGGPAAAGFAVAGLALAPQLLVDVTFAYGVSWALLGCAVAAIAVLAPRPRFAIAGTALALAALARPEILAVTALALGIVVLAQGVARTGRAGTPPAGAWQLGLGLLAILVLSVHDWLLTGDALFWANTAAANSEGQGNVRSLLEVIRFVGHHVLGIAPVLPLAALAVVDLAVRRRWMALFVVTIVPVAVALFFIASGARGTVISSRYLLPIDLGLVWAAGVGVGAIDAARVRHWWLRSVPGAPGRAWGTVALAGGLILAVAMAPSWPRTPHVRASVAAQRAKQANAARAFAAIAPALGTVPPWRGASPPADPRTLVLIPARLRAQGIVDLDLPLWAGTKLYPSLVDPAHGIPPPGTILYHDNRDDKPAPVWASVEVQRPTVVGSLRLVPLFVDARAGIWVLRVEAAPGG